MKIALITGGSRGLGRSMALHAAAKGIGVVITYKSGAAAAEEVLGQIRAAGGTAAALALDVGQSAGFPAFAVALQGALRAQWGVEGFDFLVNNAGIGIHAPFAETTEAQFDELAAIHLKAPFFLTQTLLPWLNDGGRILNVSSGLARFSLPGYAAYATMKGGVEVLTRYMAKELGARRISVNTIAPGAIETDFGGGMVRDNAAANQFVAAQTALGRAGLPDDIGGAVAALLSDETGWINGQRIEVSGGMFV
jgi:NAD(P)-dependent dehydrogenase (short-subunit alcohol dehydrogenase family)